MSELLGHKIFVVETSDGVGLEAVTDDVPPTRMTFHLSIEEAWEIGQTLLAKLPSGRGCQR